MADCKSLDMGVENVIIYITKELKKCRLKTLKNSVQLQLCTVTFSISTLQETSKHNACKVVIGKIVSPCTCLALASMLFSCLRGIIRWYGLYGYIMLSAKYYEENLQIYKNFFSQ